MYRKRHDLFLFKLKCRRDWGLAYDSVEDSVETLDWTNVLICVNITHYV